MLDSPRIAEAAAPARGLGWHEHVHDVHEGGERFFRPGYNANLVDAWIPPSTASMEKLERGARVADVGCGHGASTILMAQASRSRRSSASITTRARSRRRASARRRRGRRSRPVRGAAAADYPGSGYDLVAMFDCLRDMGDPVGAARKVRELLAPGRDVDDRRAGRGRPRRGQPQPRRPRLLRLLDAALHAGVALAGGRPRARRAGGRGQDPGGRRAAGFTHFRRVGETPFNLVFEARP